MFLQFLILHFLLKFITTKLCFGSTCSIVMFMFIVVSFAIYAESLTTGSLVQSRTGGGINEGDEGGDGVGGEGVDEGGEGRDGRVRVGRSRTGQNTLLLSTASVFCLALEVEVSTDALILRNPTIRRQFDSNC